MLTLETKQSGGKLLHHLDLRGGSVSRGSFSQQAKKDENRDLECQESVYGLDWAGPG